MPITVGSRVRRLPQFRAAITGWGEARGDTVFTVMEVHQRTAFAPRGLRLEGIDSVLFDEDRFELIEDDNKYALAFLLADGSICMRTDTYNDIERARTAMAQATGGDGWASSIHIIPIRAVESREF